jgi:hypothetical protein
MAWTTPGTAVAGAVLEADFWNSDVRDNTLALYAQSQYPYRNLIYNGAMQITQRAAVGSAQTGKTSTGFYTADRFQHVINANGTWTDTTIAEAPTASGFRNSYKTECTTADASPAAGDYSLVRQQLEGQDLQRILKGTSDAQPLVLTFWVRSNLTGTYIVELEDVDNTRSISKAYTINASATWEKKEIAFGADTTGAFDNDNAASLALNFWLSAGSTYTSGALATSWGSVTSANRAVGQVNLAGATSRYWQITGVQLEVGSVSTPFEFLPYGDELAKCQRYYVRFTGASNSFRFPGYGFATGTTTSQIIVQFPQQMRTYATPETTGTAADYQVVKGDGAGVSCNAVPAVFTSVSSFATLQSQLLSCTVASGLTGGQGAHLLASSAGVYLGFSAEL